MPHEFQASIKLNPRFNSIPCMVFRSCFFIRYVLMAIFLAFFFNTSHAQVDNRIPFKHRVGNPAPDQNIFRIKGDFTIIGNTNLTFAEYDDFKDNSGNKMIWVDVDQDSTTANSSSATLVFSEENGADPNCSEILYAGLYWAGRTHLGRGLYYEDVIGNIPGNPVSVLDNVQEVYHNDSIKYSTYEVYTNRLYDEQEALYPYYVVQSGVSQPYLTFQFFNEGEPRVKYMVGWSGDWIDVQNIEITETDSTIIATFDPITITELGMTLSVDRLVRSVGTTWDDLIMEHNSVRVTTSGTYVPMENRAVSFDKRKVKLKGPGSAHYIPIHAEGNSILYPADELGEIYVGYANVTDYVRQYGIGEYTVADLALDIGMSDPTGFFGHWGIVVVYQNSKMDWRDVTIFDGFSFMQSLQLVTPFTGEVLIDGFAAVDQGPVDLKLGVMAAEGDRTIEGDFLEINDQSGNWVRLQHPLNSPNNFFNSSIYTPVRHGAGTLVPNPRNPTLNNSPGIDIAMWDIPNPDNSVIANGQSSLTFRFGTVQDVVTLYMFAFAVRSYVPKLQSKHEIVSIDGIPVGENPEAKPNQQITFQVELRNLGDEAVEDGKIIVPLPHTAKFVQASIFPTGFGTVGFDPDMGPFGSIVWDIGDIPLPSDPSELIATLTYTLQVTDDCFVLANIFCDATISVDGGVSGRGANSQSIFSNIPFVKGFKEGNCEDEEIHGALEIPIVGLAEFAATTCAGFELFPGFEDIELPVFCKGNGSVELTDYIQPSRPEFNVYFFVDSVGGTALSNYVFNLGSVGIQKIWVTEGPSLNCTGLRIPVAIQVIPRAPEPRITDLQSCTMPGTIQIPPYPDYDYTLKYYLDNDPNSEALGSVPQIDMSVEAEHVYWISQYKEGECESLRRMFKATIDDCSRYPQIDLSILVSPSKYSYVGEVITYTFVIHNTGIVPLLDVNLFNGLTGGPYILPRIEPGEKGYITVTYEVKESDLSSGSIWVHAVAIGKDDRGREAQDDTYAEIYPFSVGFLNFYIEVEPERCLDVDNPNGFVEIKYNAEPQTGYYLLVRKHDGLEFSGSFVNQMSIKIQVPAGEYSLRLRDQDGSPYQHHPDIIVEASPILAFEVPARIEDCLVHHLAH